MASLKMHKLALHAGVNCSTASTLKGGSQTSSLSPLHLIECVYYRFASLPDSFVHCHLNSMENLAMPETTTRDCRYAMGYTIDSLYLVLQNPRVPHTQWISSSCLLEDTSG